MIASLSLALLLGPVAACSGGSPDEEPSSSKRYAGRVVDFRTFVSIADDRIDDVIAATERARDVVDEVTGGGSSSGGQNGSPTTGSTVPPSGKNVAAVRLMQPGLDAIASSVKGLLPTGLPLPEASKDLGPATVSLTNGQVSLDIRSLKAELRDGSLGMTLAVGATGTVRASGEIFGQNLSCDMQLTFEAVTGTASLIPKAANGRISLDLADVNVVVSDNPIQVSSSCSLVDRVGGVIEFVIETFRPWWSDKINEWVRGSVAPPIENALNDALGTRAMISGSVAGFDYKLAVSRIDVAPAGLDVYTDAEISYSGPAKQCGQTGNPGGGSGRSLTLAHAPQGHASLGLGFDLLQQVLNAAWQGGLLCVDINGLQALGVDFGAAAGLLGSAAGAVDIGIRASSAPQMGIAGDGNSIALKLPEATLELSMAGFKGSLQLDVYAAFRPVIRDGHVFVEATDFGLENIEITAGPVELPVPIDAFGGFMRGLVLPFLNQSLGKMPIAPAVIGLPIEGGSAIRLDAIKTKREGIYVAASLGR